MSAAGVIIRIVVLVVVFFLLIALFAFALKVFFAVVGLLAFAAVAYLCFRIFKKLFFGGKTGEPEVTTGSAMLKSSSGTVQLFRQQPGLHELINKEKAELPAPVQDLIPAESEVAVLEEGELTFKIKIKTGTHKGKVGWVDKANLSNYGKN